eukprot:5032078-Pleurochrysis_carterae.AAC.2
MLPLRGTSTSPATLTAYQCGEQKLNEGFPDSQMTLAVFFARCGSSELKIGRSRQRAAAVSNDSAPSSTRSACCCAVPRGSAFTRT